MALLKFLSLIKKVVLLAKISARSVISSVFIELLEALMILGNTQGQAFQNATFKW